MPTVFQVKADWNPPGAVTAAARYLWANPNPFAAVRAWPIQHPVDAALLWSIALLRSSPRWPPGSTGTAPATDGPVGSAVA